MDIYTDIYIYQPPTRPSRCQPRAEGRDRSSRRTKEQRAKRPRKPARGLTQPLATRVVFAPFSRFTFIQRLLLLVSEKQLIGLNRLVFIA